nr:uncharacterized protein LOC109174453 [Ipomoea trifida]
MHTFFRVRVAVDVGKPLKTKMKLKRDNGAWSIVEFRYERLPTFCFLCGILGHGEKFCHKVFRGSGVDVEKSYGPWLRAGQRRGTQLVNQRWVAPASHIDRRNWVAPAKSGDMAIDSDMSRNLNIDTDGANQAGKGKELMQVRNVDTWRRVRVLELPLP